MESTKPLTLGLVEDDDDVRVALDRLLRSMGHTVHLFASAEAFDAGSAPFDCLILDVRLPGGSGLELTERMRERGSLLPIVLITGGGDPSTRETGRRTDCVAPPALAKPFGDDDLMEAIARAIAQSATPAFTRDEG